MSKGNSRFRRANHAGSWYSDNREELSSQLEDWLSKAERKGKPARAIIAPHAGYYYCGPCGAHAYRQIDPATVKRVFILGPSHHVRMSRCALSCTESYQTPLYNLIIDDEINQKLYATGLFEKMAIVTDEGEHSIEMHLPYVAKVMESRRNQFTIVPILVGSLTSDKEQQYGKLLSSYLASPENLFIISSDFCHWGKRFNYTCYNKSCGPIWQSIQALDKEGMDIIERMDPVAFTEYLKDSQNTICGRHPIGVLLNAISSLRQKGNQLSMDMKFLNYTQSSQCTSGTDSSVSYAAGVLVIN